MAKITFVLGGARSGKSAFAEGLAKKYNDVVYIATAEAKDGEMRERIRIHRARRPFNWKTIESPYHVDKVVSDLNGKAGLVLIDCITLYITNMLLSGGKAFSEEIENSTGGSDMQTENPKQRQDLLLREINKLSQVCRGSRSDVILISNEVGLGIVPDNALSREFRDSAGCANQILADESDEVYFMVAGIAPEDKIMDIYQFKAFMNKDKKIPVYIFFGDEEFFIHEALSAVKKNLLKDSDPSLALIEFRGDEISGDVIFDELRTLPFFTCKNKVIVVEEADDFVEKYRQTLEKYLSTPAGHANLVLVCNKWDKRTKLATLVDKGGIAIECKRLKEHSLPGWVQTHAKYYKKDITARAAQRLVDDAGNNLAILDKHLEKLSIYLGEKATIDERDVDALVGVDRNRTVFELTDAVAQKDVTLALKILGQMLTHGEDSVRIISLLAWQIKRLWRAKQLLKQGGNQQKVTSELQILPFFAKRFFEQVKLYTEEGLMKNHALLLETDVKSKTSSLSTQLLLELLVYKLCA